MDYPSIGRIVHYRSYGTPKGEYQPECRAAIITQVDNSDDGYTPRLTLAVINPEGLFFNHNVAFGPAGDGGTWHWPERVQ